MSERTLRRTVIALTYTAYCMGVFMLAYSIGELGL